MRHGQYAAGNTKMTKPVFTVLEVLYAVTMTALVARLAMGSSVSSQFPPMRISADTLY
jgi:hypothetical protein